ncbi:MAG: c-type cytochrome domain-containing protein, partial [Planctomycetota bacterium]
MNRLATQVCIFLSLISLHFNVALAQEVTSKQKRQVKSIASIIDKAGRLYKSKKFKSSADKIEDAHEAVHKLAASANKNLMQLIKKEYERLERAHQLLTEKKIEIESIRPLPDPIPEIGNVSFAKQVAPILVKNCGRCHVNQSRGDFSMQNYVALMNSLHVSPGRPDTSLIVEVIADGSMPPNGEVETKQLELLKLWIRQGAKFDENNPELNLNQLTGNTMANNGNNRARLRPTQPTGMESVSFGKDVAPILIENCSGCHINARRIQGGFNMNNFVRMLRGGDSGNPLLPGSPDESVIINRLKGINSEVMPPRNKLSDQHIETIATWISEGASFDGIDPNEEIGFVAAVAKAASQSHEVLSQERDDLGVKNWNLIMSDQSPDRKIDEHFRVLGNDRGEKLDSTVELANKIRKKILKELRSDMEQPFVKGKPTIYLFDQRYDLNELGLMLVGREIPKRQGGRWDFTTVDAYVSLVVNRGKTIEDVEPSLAQQLTAVHIASLSPDVPRWFADGVGYSTAS